MFLRFIRALWGEFTQDELVKFLYLSLAAFFVIGAQWPLKLLKDSLLVGEMGARLHPYMKIGSIAVCLPFTVIYGLLVNRFKREHVLYIVVSFLTLMGGLFFALMSMPFEGNIRFFIVMAFYFYAEVFTVLTISPFWAFTNDLTSPQEAKRGYGMIVFAAQFGGFVTTFLGRILASSSMCQNKMIISMMSSVTLILFGVCIWLVIHKVKRKSLVGYNADAKKVEEKPKIPFMQGLSLIVTSPYVAGICFLTAAQEMTITWIEFNHKMMIGSVLAKNEITNFMFDFGLIIQVVSCLFSLFGTSYFQRRFGVRFCVVSYPLMLLSCIFFAKTFPSLMIFTVVMALAKGLHYALNKPVREILYIPTTKEVKYKSKVWIEAFGTRIFKCTGSMVNILPLAFSNAFGFIIPCLWVFVARFVGKNIMKLSKITKQ